MEKEYKGKNVENAINKGLKDLDIRKEEASIKVLEEGKAGLFGLMGSVPARVKIKIKGHKQGIKWEKAVNKARDLTLLLAKEIDEKVKVKSRKSGNVIQVSLESANQALLIGRKGGNLKAVNYLVNLMMKKDPDSRIDVYIDIADYRKRKKNSAREKLKEAVSKVKKKGKPVELDPMDREERKAVHRQANQIEGVNTESKGRGDERRVVVKKK